MRLEVKKQKLKSGLTLVTVPMQADSATAMLMVKAGSRNESKKINGISHFLEHMVFKGTQRWPTPMGMNQVIDSIGGVYNAWTSKEYTAFWIKVAKKHLGLGLEFLHQAVFKPLLPEKELEKERGVILEEIKMYEDNPMHKVMKSFINQIFKDSSLGQEVIGRPENIMRLKKEEFYKYMKNWYQPENMVLGIAGGMEKEVNKTVESRFKSLGKSKRSCTDQPMKLKFSQSQPRVQLVNKKIEQAHFCLGARIFKRDHQDRYVLEVLTTILGGSTSSRLWQEIREKRGLVYYIRTNSYSLTETGYLMTQAGCDVHKINQAIKITLNEYGKISQKKVLSSELKLAKEYLKGRLALGLEDSQDVAGLFASDLLLDNKLRSIEEIKKRIDQVEISDVLRVANGLLKPDQMNLTVVGPFEPKQKESFQKILI